MSGDVLCSEFLTWISIFALQKHTKIETLVKRHKHAHTDMHIQYALGVFFLVQNVVLIKSCSPVSLSEAHTICCHGLDRLMHQIRAASIHF